MLGYASLAKSARAEPIGLIMTPDTCCSLGPAQVSFAASDVCRLAVENSQQEASVEGHRTGGMTAIGVLDIIFGGLEILKGIFHTAVAIRLMYELLRLGAFY